MFGSQNDDKERLNISFGLIASYGVFLFFFLDTLKKINFDTLSAILISTAIIFWGIGSLLLTFWIFFYSLNLKYKNKGVIEIYDYSFQPSEKLKRIAFDQGISVYLSGFFYALIQTPSGILINHFNITNWVAKSIIIVGTVLLILVILNKLKILK